MNFRQKLEASSNPNTPVSLLETLATDEDSYVRYCAAMNPNATELAKRLYLMTQANS